MSQAGVTALALGMCGCATLHAASKPPADPCAPLSLADVVTIIADTDVKQVAMPPANGAVVLGTYFRERHELLLNAIASDAVKRLTLLHELYHARQMETGKDNDDETVQRCAITEYVRLFGGDLDLPESLRMEALNGR